jgi:hypothetical protein
MGKKLLIISLVMIMLLIPTTAAFAGDGDPPRPPRSGDNIQEGYIVVEEPISGPIQARGYIGGPGGQSGVLSSILYWQIFVWYEYVKGGSRISLTGGPTAKAWTSLYKQDNLMQTTSNNPCWTTTSCTSWTNKYFGIHNHWLNFAETVVYWSSGGNSYAHATAQRQF